MLHELSPFIAQGYHARIGICWRRVLPQEVILPQAKHLVRPMSASLFPMIVQALEESPASPHRVYPYSTAERCPSVQTISNRSRKGYSMHGLVPEPCLSTGRGMRPAGERAAVHTLSPSVSILETFDGVTNWYLRILAPGETREIYARL